MCCEVQVLHSISANASFSRTLSDISGILSNREDWRSTKRTLQLWRRQNRRRRWNLCGHNAENMNANSTTVNINLTLIRSSNRMGWQAVIDKEGFVTYSSTLVHILKGLLLPSTLHKCRALIFNIGTGIIFLQSSVKNWNEIARNVRVGDTLLHSIPKLDPQFCLINRLFRLYTYVRPLQKKVAEKLFWELVHIVVTHGKIRESRRTYYVDFRSCMWTVLDPYHRIDTLSRTESTGHLRNHTGRLNTSSLRRRWLYFTEFLKAQYHIQEYWPNHTHCTRFMLVLDSVKRSFYTKSSCLNCEELFNIPYELHRLTMLLSRQNVYSSLQLKLWSMSMTMDIVKNKLVWYAGDQVRGNIKPDHYIEFLKNCAQTYRTLIMSSSTTKMFTLSTTEKSRFNFSVSVGSFSWEWC